MRGSGTRRTRSLDHSRPSHELGEDFFNEIIAHPVPLDLNILKCLKRSPLGLDLYLWPTYRTFALKCPIRLTWKQLYRQPPPAQARDAGVADPPVS